MYMHTYLPLHIQRSICAYFHIYTVYTVERIIRWILPYPPWSLSTTPATQGENFLSDRPNIGDQDVRVLSSSVWWKESDVIYDMYDPLIAVLKHIQTFPMIYVVVSFTGSAQEVLQLLESYTWQYIYVGLHTEMHHLDIFLELRQGPWQK